MKVSCSDFYCPEMAHSLIGSCTICKEWIILSHKGNHSSSLFYNIHIEFKALYLYWYKINQHVQYESHMCE